MHLFEQQLFTTIYVINNAQVLFLLDIFIATNVYQEHRSYQDECTLIPFQVVYLKQYVTSIRKPMCLYDINVNISIQFLISKNYVHPKNYSPLIRFRSVVVITCALHAQGPGFEPQRNYHAENKICRFHGVMVSTQDSEYCDPSSNPGGTFQ